MKKVITTVYLNKEYANVKPSLVFDLTAPNGFKITHLMSLTTDMKTLFDNSSITIFERVIDRDVNEKNIRIGGMTINRVSPEILEYESDTEDEAKRKYNSLKGLLPDYRFLGHDCETKAGEPCSRFKSQKKLEL